MLDQDRWEDLLEGFLRDREGVDSAHGMDHVKRVVANARQLAAAEGATLEVVLPAAWLHDCVALPKDSPARRAASEVAARTARQWLEGAGYDPAWLDGIEHAIAAHSFSAGIAPRTIEAQVVQDADRLDSLGAIGIARCLMLGGQLDRPLYDPQDPFCESRAPDDRISTVDHFHTKLLLLVDSMQTEAGRREAARRTEFMREFLKELEVEVEPSEGD